MWSIVMCLIFVAFFSYFKENIKKLLKIILFKLYFSTIYFYLIFVLVIWPFPILNGRSVENAKTWARLIKYMTIFYGIKWEIRNDEVVSKDRGAVIVANHQSILDMVGMFQIWETVDKLTAVAKKAILYAGPLGIVSYFGGVVFIDRSKPKTAYKQLEDTLEVLKKKTKIWIYPEGTRNYDNTKFLPFKKGGFVTAIAAQVPIIPVVYSPYYFIDRKKYTISKGRCIMQCLEEVPTTGLTMDDVPELIERVRNMMFSAYKELSKEVMTTRLKE